MFYFYFVFINNYFIKLYNSKIHISRYGSPCKKTPKQRCRSACPFTLMLLSADFFRNILSGTLAACQTVWIHIRRNFLSVLIWVQTVCKGYQQMTKVAASKEKGQVMKHYKW